MIQELIKSGAGGIQYSQEKESYYVDFIKFTPLEERSKLEDDENWKID